MKKLHIPTIQDVRDVSFPESTIFEHIINGRFDELKKIGFSEDELDLMASNLFKVLQEKKEGRDDNSNS